MMSVYEQSVRKTCEDNQTQCVRIVTPRRDMVDDKYESLKGRNIRKEQEHVFQVSTEEL
jgi:hypothetical protein